MILRRVIQHVRKQEWKAIWIDLAIVVVGVFIGIQVSNWNEQRADARLGSDYVNRLSRDLGEDQAGIRGQADYYAAVLESVRKTDALLRTSAPDPRALVVNAYRATEVIYIPPVRATWDQIVSSGHLALLPEGAVESGLSQYYSIDAARDTYTEGLDSAYRKTVRTLIPLTMQSAMRAGCSDVRDKWGNVVGFADECTLDVDPAELGKVAETLRSDPAVLADLQYQYSDVVSAVLNLRGVSGVIKDAQAALVAEPKAAGGRTP